jgi:TonB family protein
MRHRILIMVSIALLGSGFVFGQEVPLADQASIQGRLADNSNSGIARATVILSQPSGQTVGITTTNPGGEYAFRTMASGDYTVQAFAVGFGPSRLITVTLPRGKSVTQDIAMDIRFVSASNSTGLLTGVLRGGELNSQARPPIMDGRLRVDAETARQNLLRTMSPVTPPLAQQARVSGVVLVDIVINTNGEVKEAHVLSGHPLLQKAAIDAVSTNRYKPFFQNGAPAEVITTISVNFPPNE